MAATKCQNKAKKAEDENASDGPAKLSGKEYERELAKLHGELVKLQLWVVAKGLKVVVVFEGRDGAGKGGVIKAISERVSPRVYRVVALPAPTEREKSQMYIQRYMRHLPAAGEIVIFDRSWYNRAGVERVMELDGRSEAVPRADARGSRRPLASPGSFSSNIGWRSVRRSRPVGSRRGSMIRARSGSCRRWI